MAVGKIHSKDEVKFSSLLEEFEERVEGKAGAIGSFIGTVRKKGEKGGEVQKLHYERADEAQSDLEEIASEIEETIEGIEEVAIHHVVDDLEPGDEILYVLVGGEHRKEVFEALPEIMDRIKTDVRIWKKEITNEESYWMHEAKE